MMRRTLVIVRCPRVRIAPTSRFWACRHERWTNSGANARMIPAKRAGRGRIAVSLGGDATSLSVTPASSPHILDAPQMAKVELRGSDATYVASPIWVGSPRSWSSDRLRSGAVEPGRPVHVVDEVG